MTVRLPVRGRSVVVTDLLGSSRRIAVHGGAITLEAGPSPVYVAERL